MFITAASLIGLGLYGIDDLKKMNKNTRTLYADRVVCIQQLSDIRFAYVSEILPIPQNVENKLLTYPSAEKRVANAQKIINDNWHNYKLTYLTPEEALLAKQTDVIKKQADSSISSLQAMLAKNDTLGIDNLYKREASTDAAPFAVQLSKLMDLQVRVGHDIYNNSDEIYRTTSTRFIILILFSLAVALSLSFYIIKNIRALIKDILTGNTIIKESKEKYYSLLEHASDAIFLLAENNSFIEVNQSACELLGYSREEFLRMNASDAYPPDDLEAHLIQWEELWKNKTTMTEQRLLKKDGTEVEVEISSKVLSVNRYLAIVRDISERKKAEQELISSERKYKFLFESNPQALCMVAKDDLSIIAINEASANLYGYTRDELLNKNASLFRLPEDRELQREIFQKDFSNTADIGVVRHVKKDGTPISIQLIVHDIVFEGRSVRLCLSNDITEKLKAEAALQKSEANLKTIMNTTDTAYALLDKELNVMEYNQMAIKFVNTQYHFFFEREIQLSDLIPKDRFPQFLTYAAEVLNGRNISYETNYVQDNGSVFWFYVRLFPITNDKNEIFGLMLALSDITERKTTENNLKGAYKQVQDHIDRIKDMAWKQSHVIRRPLANLKALTALLNEEPSNNDLLNFINIELDALDVVIVDMAEDASNRDI